MQRKKRTLNRLEYIIESRGMQDAVDFARQTMKIYRNAVVNGMRHQNTGTGHPHHAALPEYRCEFIQTYCDYKKFLEENENSWCKL